MFATPSTKGKLMKLLDIYKEWANGHPIYDDQVLFAYKLLRDAKPDSVFLCAELRKEFAMVSERFYFFKKDINQLHRIRLGRPGYAEGKNLQKRPKDLTYDYNSIPSFALEFGF